MKVIILAVIHAAVVAQDAVGAGWIDKQRISRLAVSVESQLIEPIDATGEVAPFPLTELAAAGGHKGVVVALETNLAVGWHQNVVAALDPEDVISQPHIGRTAEKPNGVPNRLIDGIAGD